MVGDRVVVISGWVTECFLGGERLVVISEWGKKLLSGGDWMCHFRVGEVVVVRWGSGCGHIRLRNEVVVS